jgi:hypothetical protein
VGVSVGARARGTIRDRELAFYGAEDLTPSGFYGREDASEAREAARSTVALVAPHVIPDGGAGDA